MTPRGKHLALTGMNRRNIMIDWCHFLPLGYWTTAFGEFIFWGDDGGKHLTEILTLRESIRHVETER